MKFNYEDTGEEVQGEIPVEQPTPEQVQASIKKLMYEKAREERQKRQEKINLLTAMSNPEDKEKTVTLTTKAIKTTMTSEITPDNVNQEPYKDFSEEEKEFFDKKKYNVVYDLHEQVMKDDEVLTGVETLKEKGMYDGRKQRHKKKPGDYVGSVASFKLLFDVMKKQTEQEKQIAVLAYEVQRNKELVDSKLDQIGQELLVQKKLNALFALGIPVKKLEVYKLHLEDSSLTRQQLADAVGKSKPTVIKWLQEIEELSSNLEKSLPR